MARRVGSGLQEELMRWLRPVLRRDDVVSERIAPALAEIGNRMAGRPATEVFTALEAVVHAAGGTPDRSALQEFAAQIEAGENPFA